MIEQRMRVNKKKFGKFIASRRETIAGIETQELLAKKLHITTGYMGKLEIGGGLPSFDTFIDLADALLMTPGDLMMVLAGREEPKTVYMEMNNWLYKEIIRAVQEYEALTGLTPSNKAGLPSGHQVEPDNRRNTDFETQNPIADATPDVQGYTDMDNKSGGEQDPTGANPTENSQL